MKTIILLYLAVVACGMAFANDFRHVESVEKGHVRNPILYLDNNTPPIVKLKPSDIIWLTFPREVKNCSDGSNLFLISKLNENGDKSEKGAVRHMEIRADQDALQKIVQVMQERGKRSLYSLPQTNVNCIFPNGDIKFFLVKLSDDSYNSVKFMEPEESRDYDIFREAESVLSANDPNGIEQKDAVPGNKEAAQKPEVDGDKIEFVPFNEQEEVESESNYVNYSGPEEREDLGDLLGRQ